MEFLPTKVTVGNTYKTLSVRGLTVDELLTLAKISENEKLINVDLKELETYISKIFKVEDGYTIRDVYISDIKFGLIYSQILTDEEYSFSVKLQCNNCDKEIIKTIKPQDYSIDLGNILPEAQVLDYQIGPIQFGDLIDSLEYIKTLGDKYDNYAKVKILLACLLKVPNKTFADKLELINTNVPAKVAIEVQKNDYVIRMDIIPDDIEVVCPHCQHKQNVMLPFEIKDLLPSI